MNQSYLNEMFQLSEKAKRLELAGKSQEALAVYLEIHKNYFPNTSNLYERPAILLEKYHRYDEALAMLEKAARLIDEGKISGNKEQFLHRIERVKARVKADVPKIPEKPKFKFKLKLNLNFNFKGYFKGLIPRIKTRKPQKEDYVVLGLLGLVIALYIFSLVYTPPKRDTILMLDIDNFMDGAPSTFSHDKKEAEDLPLITQKMIDAAIKKTKRMTGVINVAMVVQDDVVGMAILMDPNSTEDEYRAAAKRALDSLAYDASQDDPELRAPNSEKYGGLFDIYYAIVSVSKQGDATEEMIRGYKRAKAPDFVWTK